MTDKPPIGFKPGTQQLGKHDFRGTSLPPGPPSTDFEVIQADELAALRWVRANREAVEALLAGKAAVVPTPQSLDLSTAEGIRRVMGEDMPAGEGYDIPWIRRLREKTGCGLLEAKRAHEVIGMPARKRLDEARAVEIMARAHSPLTMDRGTEGAKENERVCHLRAYRALLSVAEVVERQ